MKKSMLFVINPISGIGKQRTIERHVHKYIKPTEYDVEFAYTQAPKHATEIARNAAQNNTDIVVAVGGDGTINEIANGLIHTDTSMGIIPTGSGNGFARFLNIPQIPDRALKFLSQAEVQKIDCAKINDHYFINVAGIGFDAEISHLFAEFGSRGFKSYLQLITKHLQTFTAKEFELQIDRKIIRQKAFLISFANSSTWGNNAHIAPLAQVDDGILDIAIIEEFPIINTPALATRLFTKNIHKSKFLKTIRCESVIIKNKGILKTHIDGEPVSFDGDVKIEMIPRCLKVLAKKTPSRFRLGVTLSS